MIDPVRMVETLRRLHTMSRPDFVMSAVEDAANMIERLAAAVDVPGFNAGVDACIGCCQAVYLNSKNGQQELSFDKRHLQLGEQYAYHQMAKYDLPGLRMVPAQEQSSGKAVPA